METAKKKFKFKMPHAYVLIFGLVVLACILTYIVPAGVYDMVEVNGKNVVDAASFHYVDQTPVSPWNMILAIPQGLIKQAGLIFMIMVISASMEIINRTGALEASIGRLAKRFRSKLYIIIPLLLTCFAFLGANNVNNSIVAFIPLGLLIAFNLGADACVGVALVGMGMNLGFTGGAFSASNVGTAQTICGLPLFSGYAYRIVLTVVLVIAGSIVMIRYIKKLQRDPSQSAVYNVEGVVVPTDDDVEMPEFNTRRKLVLAVFLVGLAVVIYGAVKLWSANDAIPAIFLVTCVACGFIYGFSADEIASIFIDGAKKITFGALIVGISAAIGIVLTNGQIIHTIVSRAHGMVIVRITFQYP